MNLGGVEFPQNTIEAIDTHKLVVFAGAGVSMGEPSCLPSYWKLAGAWDSWLKEYWHRRSDGVPVELSNGEINAMINWLPNLGDRFPEGVDIAVTVSCERIENHSPVHELGQSGLVERFPNDMARLVTYFLRNDSEHFYLYHLKDKILDPLADQQIDEAVKQALNEALIQSERTPLNPH